jgi:ABC-type dipeptide/oligopeptide/nickel transport system ATPase component
MLSIEHLSVEYYRRGKTVPAVRDFSLAINDGETVGLVGESGSGKSSVALAVLRLIRPQEGRITSGRILLDGRDLLRMPDAAMRQVRGGRVSMIFQDPFTSLNPVMRIHEQMSEVLTAHRTPSTAPEGHSQGPNPLSSGDDGVRLRKALGDVQLDPDRVLTSYPHQLSGGQRQRVMIAMALLGRPELVLADEPTTALDVLVQKDILELLMALQKELNISMLLISHNLGLVGQYARRLAVMKEGSLVEEGPAQELLRHPGQDYTRRLIESLPPLTRT